MSPGGPHHIQDLHQAGGIMAVMTELTKAGLIDQETMTVTGSKLKSSLKDAQVTNRAIIRELNNPYHAKAVWPSCVATWPPMAPWSNSRPWRRK